MTALVLSCLCVLSLAKWTIKVSGPSLFLLLQLPVGVQIISADINHQQGWLIMGWMSSLLNPSFEPDLPWSAALLSTRRGTDKVI